VIIKSNSSVMIDRVKDTIDSDFDALLWVLKAASKDWTHLNGIFIDDHVAVCTDGYRMHVAELDTAPESGFYRVRQATKKQILLEKGDEIFPQYGKAFPSDKPEITFSSTYCNSDFSFFVEDVLKTGLSVSVDYMRDAYMNGGEFTVEAYPSKKIVIIKESSRKALIAGLNRNGVQPIFKEAQKAA